MPSYFSIVVGLGNPGDQYRKTRHNIGFNILDTACEGNPVSGVSTWRSKFGSLVAEGKVGGERVWAVKPQRFMNLSGPPVREMMDFYQIPVERLIVIHDEIDLPLGRLRIKQGGGDGGHKGIRSLASALGSPDFARLRVGVGRPIAPESSEGTDPKRAYVPGVQDWVLGHFSREEEPLIRATIARACQAIEVLCASGVQTAQQLFNAAPESP